MLLVPIQIFAASNIFYGTEQTSLSGVIQDQGKNNFVLVLDQKIDVVTDPKEKGSSDKPEKEVSRVELIIIPRVKIEVTTGKPVQVTGSLRHGEFPSEVLMDVDKIETTSRLSDKQIEIYYEPETVSLAGKLSLETFPGPPNYDNIKTGDQPETCWILNLDEPVTVIPKPEKKDEINEPETGVRWLQLVMDYKKVVPKKLGFNINKKVKVTGTLYHALTGHHHTTVLLRVDKAVVEN